MTNKLWVKKLLYSLRMPEGGDLIVHIQKFNQICSDVRSLDVKIDEEDRALLLLCSLSVSYDSFITTLVYGKEILSFEKVVGVSDQISSERSYVKVALTQRCLL